MHMVNGKSRRVCVRVRWRWHTYLARAINMARLLAETVLEELCETLHVVSLFDQYANIVGIIV